MAIERKHKGAHSELVACAWLLGRGFEVFRNVSPHGPYDLIAIQGPKVLHIDVKSDTRNSQGYRRRTIPPPGIVYLLVDPEGRIESIPEDAA